METFAVDIAALSVPYAYALVSVCLLVFLSVIFVPR